MAQEFRTIDKVEDAQSPSAEQIGRLVEVDRWLHDELGLNRTSSMVRREIAHRILEYRHNLKRQEITAELKKALQAADKNWTVALRRIAEFSGAQLSNDYIAAAETFEFPEQLLIPIWR